MFSEKNMGFIYSLITLLSKIENYLNKILLSIEIDVILSQKNVFKFPWKVCKIKVKKIKVSIIIAIIIEYVWIFLNKQGSQYGLDPKYAEILNVAKFWIWQGSQYVIAAFWICPNMSWQSSEYISGSKYARILNMTGFWIPESYTGFKVLSMFYTIHSMRSFFKLMSTHWKKGILRTPSKKIMASFFGWGSTASLR